MTTVTLRVSLLTLICMAGAQAASTQHTLYTRLGGVVGVTAIANTLIDRVVADPVTGPSFKDSKLDRIKKLLAEQICELSDGPCHYSGDPMKEVHAGQHITEAQFYRMVDVLRDILRERAVDLRSTNELLRLLAPMKRDVVEHGIANGTPESRAAAAAAQVDGADVTK